MATRGLANFAARAIDKYFELRQASETQPQGAAAADGAADSAVDPRLESIVDRMLARCITDQQYEQVSLSNLRLTLF